MRDVNDPGFLPVERHTKRFENFCSGATSGGCLLSSKASFSSFPICRGSE